MELKNLKFLYKCDSEKIKNKKSKIVIYIQYYGNL